MSKQRPFFVGLTFGVGFAILAACSAAGQVTTRPSALAMEKYASKEAIFVLYKPVGWVVTESTQTGFRTISVAEPHGACEAAMFYGTNPQGSDVPALTRLFLGGIARQFPDLSLNNVTVSRDHKKVAFHAAFTHPHHGKRQFRCWVCGHGNEFVYTSIEASESRLPELMPGLLTILSNIHLFKGAFGGVASAPVQVEMVHYRLSDGSASFMIPQGWRCRELGKGNIIASDASGAFAFIVASVDVITPQLGVSVPGVPVLPYMAPNHAFAALASAQGVAANMRCDQVFPRPDVAGEMAQVHTAGPVNVEEFIYTCDTRTGKCKGYTFGFTFGSRLGTNWNFRHLTVMAPVDRFNTFAGVFASMLQSYRIDDQWVKNYIQQGMARLRQLQQQTAQVVARNAQEIHQMMQAAYDERQKSMDYIDYQRTSYIRGTQDWISNMEGGTVYHSDSWGTQNTTTGEYWQGQPYNYVNFDGRNPKHNEDMIPINSRQLWEQYAR